MRSLHVTWKRFICLAGVTLTAVSLASPAVEAEDWLHRKKHEIKIGYLRNRAWPQPFSEMSAMQTRAPFHVMAHKGWMLNNTIGHQLFRSGDGALTAAGRSHLEWIAREAPEQRRVVHVVRGHSQPETEARVAAVRSALSDMHFPGAPPQIFITNVSPATSPGVYASQITRQRLQVMPPPTLPAKSTGTSGGGGGGGGP